MCIDGIARVAHEALRAYRVSIGQPRVPSWDGALLEGRERMLATVRFVLTNQDCDLHSVGASLGERDLRKAELVRAVILSLRDFR
jgi:hypothetical protein